jgi:hypothetical protein
MTEETAPISEETQLENITKMCDGYSEVSDEGYKDTFFNSYRRNYRKMYHSNKKE